jgi:anti-sigma B factor antagonist
VQMPGNSETGRDAAFGVEAGPVRSSGEMPPPNQQIQVMVEHIADNLVVLHVTGEIDLLTANVLSDRLREHLAPANRVLALDLTGVTFLGSAGLAEIVSASRKADEGAGRMLLVADNRAVLRPLEVTGLLPILTVYHSVEAAIEAAAS